MKKLTKQKGFWLLLAALVLLAVLLILALIIKNKANKDQPAAATSSITKSTNSSQSTSEAAKTAAIIEDLPYSRNKFVTGTEQLPKSLQGTEVDGEIIINDKAELVATRGLRRLYDYFLSALGEEDRDTIDARVEAYILNTTPQPAAEEAIEIYYQYQAYLQQLSKIQNQDNAADNDLQTINKGIEGEVDFEAIERQQKQIKAVRKQLFERQVESAFFTIEDQLQDYNKQMLKIAQDKSLTVEQKQQAKQDYLLQAPESLTKKQATQQANLEQLLSRTEQMKKRGADEEELFQMRTELVGVEAAERLAKLDLQNQDFDRRFEAYQQQKQQVLNSALSDSAKQQKIDRLQQQLFNEREQKRLTGYEQYKNNSS